MSTVVPHPGSLETLRIDTVVAAGVSTRVLALGDTGSPIVLLHGLTGHAELWLSVLPELARGHRVFAPDLIGRGYTPLPPDITTANAYQYMVRQATDLLTGLDLTDVTLVGSSLGALVAGLAALDEPERVRRLVLISSGTLANPPGQLGSSTRRSLEGLEALRPPITLAKLRAHLAGLLRSPAELAPEYLYARLLIFSSDGVRRNMEFLARLLAESPPSGRYRLRERVGEITQPTLLIWGEKDPKAEPRNAEAVRERMRNALLTVFEGCGHLPFLERPDRFARAVVDFIETSSR